MNALHGVGKPIRQTIAAGVLGNAEPVKIESGSWTSDAYGFPVAVRRWFATRSRACRPAKIRNVVPRDQEYLDGVFTIDPTWKVTDGVAPPSGPSLIGR